MTQGFSRKVAVSPEHESGHEEPIGTVQQLYDGTLLPDVQVKTLRHLDRLFPTRTVKCGTHSLPLPLSGAPLRSFSFQSNGKTFDLYDYIFLNRVSGLLAIKHGGIAFETYQLGNTDQTRWASMSVAK